MSWVSIDDVVGAIMFALTRDDVSGVVNVTAPAPVTQADYARTLGRVLRRPAVLPAPGFAVRLVLGEFANEVLEGQRVIPERLLGRGYAFRHPELEPALRQRARASARGTRSRRRESPWCSPQPPAGRPGRSRPRAPARS